MTNYWHFVTLLSGRVTNIYIYIYLQTVWTAQESFSFCRHWNFDSTLWKKNQLKVNYVNFCPSFFVDWRIYILSCFASFTLFSATGCLFCWRRFLPRINFCLEEERFSEPETLIFDNFAPHDNHAWKVRFQAGSRMASYRHLGITMPWMSFDILTGKGLIRERQLFAWQNLSVSWNLSFTHFVFCLVTMCLRTHLMHFVWTALFC